MSVMCALCTKGIKREAANSPDPIVWDADAVLLRILLIKLPTTRQNAPF